MKTDKMETIEQAAKDYVEENKFSTRTSPTLNDKMYDAFKAGVEFAQQWYEVDDFPIPSDMPPENILIRLESGKIFRIDEDWEDERLEVTHWRPIYLK